ncbi:MAG: PGF-pre-PGF domain-containing protein [Candidatus Aenigmarchaeota archaeon]|nr:PGF-pre-PGF domain-containing protein [Candidatus Aenigmarchaeota archaeon]
MKKDNKESDDVEETQRTKNYYLVFLPIILLLILSMYFTSDFTGMIIKSPITGYATSDEIGMTISRETVGSEAPPRWVKQTKKDVNGLVVDFDFGAEDSESSEGYFKVVVEEMPVMEIFIGLEAEIENASVTVKRLDEKPEYLPNVSRTVLKIGYMYLEITSDAPTDKIKEANISFKVDNTWMRKHEIKRAEIKMLRWHNATWNDIETSVVSHDEKYTYYMGISPGLSAFAIIARQFEAGNIICNSFEKRCFQDDLKECSSYGTSWTLSEPCEFGCLEGKCKGTAITASEGITITSMWIIIIVFILFALIVYVLIKMRS